MNTNTTQGNFMVAISLEIPESLHEALVDLGKEVLEDYEVSRSITSNPKRGHISLYVGIFPNENKGELLKTIESIVSKFPVFKLQPKELSEKNRFVSISFKNCTELQKMHERLVCELNPLREGLIKDKYKNEETLAKLTTEELKNLKKWGYPYGMSSFYPHLTIGRFVNKTDALKAVKSTVNLKTLAPSIFKRVEVVILQESQTGKEKSYFTLK